MSSSISSAAAALDQDLKEMLRVLEDHSTEVQLASSTSPHFSRVAGILKYNRESEHNWQTIIPSSQPQVEYPVKCVYCGREARPSLNISWQEEFESCQDAFCCGERYDLYVTLVSQRCIPMESDLKEDKPADHRRTSPGKNSDQDPNGLPDPSDPFLKEEEVVVVLPVCDRQPVEFGLCHRQDGGECLEKSYSSGVKFLTLFLDGSTQMFYPSGLLALIIVVTKENGRVCIVYDDVSAPSQSVRAIFHSDGRATCYHSNGNIRLSMDKSGGQCFNEAGARLRRWTWSCSTRPSRPSTPMLPIFLSLNNAVGVRVLGKEQVFVSFLASGQKAKVHVGNCCAKCQCRRDGPPSSPWVSKEELSVIAAREKIHQLIQHLHLSLTKPFHPKLRRTMLDLSLGASAHQQE